MGNENIAEFSAAQFQKKLESIYNNLTKNKKTSELPKAYVLGGQPGAGKSSLIAKFKEEAHGNIVAINGDEFRKAHPNFAKLHEAYGEDYVKHTAVFSGKMTEALIEKCSAEGYNLVIEGTLRNPNTPIKTANILKDKGYDVTLAVMAVPPTMSYFGTLTRYETMQEAGTIPRATTKEQHDQTAGLIVENIGVVYEAKVFDNIQLYNRAGECLYNQVETPNLNPKTTMSQEHNRPLTMDESAQCRKELPVICKGMKERNDPRLSEVIKYSYEVGLVDVKHKAAREQSSNLMGMSAWKDAVDNPVKGINNAGRENAQMQINEQETERN